MSRPPLTPYPFEAFTPPPGAEPPPSSRRAAVLAGQVWDDVLLGAGAVPAPVVVELDWVEEAAAMAKAERRRVRRAKGETV